ncbi:C45 family autoproteolytic acyltransferase/hydolase [Actinoplanes sp. URMC 104]|uniref:C45 family autoproteolytic acyltransferase/hydolase n=1 Tax=Actinoplanes sp. URMC 104 TaxID=3423409 RepID=UPI003F19E372
MTTLAFHGINEPLPGPRWKQLFDATWPGYRSWYLAEGDAARPSLDTARDMLARHMPELMSTWERLAELTGDVTAARMLSLWEPPRFATGCSQTVLTGDRPVLIRNYDYRPDLCERVVYSSAFTGRRVIGSGDCLWGLVDGMNDAGLVVSLTAVRDPARRPGFAIPLVVRYVLETAATLADAVAVLRRVPVNMAYNLMLLDRAGNSATVFVRPGAPAEVSALRATTNHRGTEPDDPAHARSLQSVERQQTLLALLAQQTGEEAMIEAFLQPPLHRTEYARGFGTMYTAVYRPDEGTLEYRWPGSVWRRDFDSPDAVHTVALPGPSKARESVDEPMAPQQSGDMWTPDQLDRATPAELADLAEQAITTLARSGDSEAFGHLLRLTRITGESLGTSARSLAEQVSWSGVADLAGTSKQAAWERWRAR